MRRSDLIPALGCMLLAVACRPDPIPKPRGYFRIDLPEARHVPWDGQAPFSAELPTYAGVTARSTADASRWYDLRFTGMRATIHLTWSPIRGDLAYMIEDAHTFKGKHEAMAAGIARQRVLRPEERVYGTVFHVEGDVASPLVFYLTDSTRHFLYGSLYFDARPNADSLAPVTARIRSDMEHFVRTLRWAP